MGTKNKGSVDNFKAMAEATAEYFELDKQELINFWNKGGFTPDKFQKKSSGIKCLATATKTQERCNNYVKDGTSFCASHSKGDSPWTLDKKGNPVQLSSTESSEVDKPQVQCSAMIKDGKKTRQCKHFASSTNDMDLCGKHFKMKQKSGEEEEELPKSEGKKKPGKTSEKTSGKKAKGRGASKSLPQKSSLFADSEEEEEEEDE
tara:strand:- start:490 stop:1101 length:612 start_codon:yes stop_codon:yes gene_type:complete